MDNTQIIIPEQSVIIPAKKFTVVGLDSISLDGAAFMRVQQVDDSGVALGQPFLVPATQQELGVEIATIVLNFQALGDVNSRVISAQP